MGGKDGRAMSTAATAPAITPCSRTWWRASRAPRPRWPAPPAWAPPPPGCSGSSSAGDHVVAARDLYGTTAAYLAGDGRRLGVETTFVDATDTAAILGALRPATRAVFVESISNPLLRLVDLPAVAAVLAPRGIDLVVDSSHGLAGGAAAHRARGHRGDAQPHQVHLRARRRHRRPGAGAQGADGTACARP